MKAITFDQPGAYKVLKISEVELPLPNKDQILIKVVCAGVNRPDIVQREGNYPPPKDHSTILGLEVSGYVEKVGNNVQDFSVGDKVAALVNGGGYAEYCIAEYQSTFHIPGDLSFDEAACIPECFFTVWSNLVMRGKLKNKQKVLIHGGTSGIGLAAIQVAKIFDSLVITTVGNNEKVLFCENLGVDKVINYKEQDFFDEIKKSNIGDVDLILDYIGGDYISKNINLLNTDGSLINIGFMKGSKSELNLMKVMLKRLNITGSTLRIRNDNFKGRILNELKSLFSHFLSKEKLNAILILHLI